MELKGHGGPANLARAIGLLERAAAENLPMAFCNLGDIYSDGQFGVLDNEKAREWYQKAADLKDPVGLRKLGTFLYRQGLVDVVNARELNIEAAQYMKEAADLGDEGGRTNFAKFLMDGIGVRVDVEEAIKQLALAVAAGFVQAKVALAQVLYEGKGGTVRDTDEALTLWREAAEAGNGDAREALRKLGLLD
jgi:hypothetical protein